MKVARTGMRCDYANITITSRCWLIDRTHVHYDTDGPRFVEIDTWNHRLMDGWQEVYDEKLDALLSKNGIDKQWDSNPYKTGYSLQTNSELLTERFKSNSRDLNDVSEKPCLLKRVEHTTLQCPECLDARGRPYVDIYTDHRGDSVCGECGLLCHTGMTPLPESAPIDSD